MPKSAIYVDAYNLYYSLKYSGNYDLLWLDFGKLFRMLAPASSADPIYAKYFTAKWHNRPDSDKRHKILLAAIKAKCPFEFITIWGEFKSDTYWDEPEKQREKRSDVGLAVNMLADTMSGDINRAYLLAYDSDYVPLLQMIKKRTDAETIVCLPPDCNCDDLVSEATTSVQLTREILERAQLPEFVATPAGVFRKPAEWSAYKAAGYRKSWA